MKSRSLALSLALSLASAVASAGPSLTLYTSDLGLVKETRAVDFRGGRDTLRLEGVSNRLDPSALRLAGWAAFATQVEAASRQQGVS